MEIKKSKSVDGLGLFSKKNIKNGEIIFTLSGQLLDHPTRESIHIGNGVHVIDEHGMFINHSFNPTTVILDGKVVACVDINADDEITFNYNDTELQMDCPFESDGQKVTGNIK